MSLLSPTATELLRLCVEADSTDDPRDKGIRTVIALHAHRVLGELIEQTAHKNLSSSTTSLNELAVPATDGELIESLTFFSILEAHPKKLDLAESVSKAVREFSEHAPSGWMFTSTAVQGTFRPSNDDRFEVSVTWYAFHSPETLNAVTLNWQNTTITCKNTSPARIWNIYDALNTPESVTVDDWVELFSVTKNDGLAELVPDDVVAPLLMQLRDTASNNVLVTLIGRLEGDVGPLWEFADSKDKEIVAAVARHPLAPVELIEHLACDEVRVLNDYVQNPNRPLTDSICELALASPRPSTRKLLAGRVDCPEKWLVVLAGDGDASVRAVVRLNPNASDRTRLLASLN